MLAIITSQQFLLSQKKNENSDTFIQQLAQISETDLFNELLDDAHKTTFWINCYNAFSLYLLKQADPNVLLSSLKRKIHFNKKAITIAGIQMSLNDVEHSFLRKSRVWWSKGYLQKWFVFGFEKKARVDVLDFRIHFALNCGGMSCPPIRYYENEKLDFQLDMATGAFLETESNYNKTKNTVTVSRLLNWYIADFGGKSGLITILKKFDVLPKESNPKIEYAEYKWKADLDNFE